MNKTNPPFLNGVPELLALQLLARSEMYGYKIVKEIRVQSKEAFNFGEGCIYPYLHWLEKTKLVESHRVEKDGRSRKYYRLTDRGQRRLEALTKDWNRVKDGVSMILEVAHA